MSDFQISPESLANENCQNSRISNYIDTELGPVTKLEEKHANAKKLASCWQILTPMVFLRFIDTWFVILTFSVNKNPCFQHFCCCIFQILLLFFHLHSTMPPNGCFRTSVAMWNKTLGQPFKNPGINIDIGFSIEICTLSFPQYKEP